MTASIFTLATRTEAQALRDRIADLESRAELIEGNAEAERDPEVVDRMLFVADDFRARADEVRKRLNANEMACGLTKLVEGNE